MTDHIIEVLHHNLQEVFGENDATRRRAAIAELYTEDCIVNVMPGIFAGHEALDKLCADLRAMNPHFAYTPRGEAQVMHDAGILAWDAGPKGEAPAYTGLDVIIVHEGKIKVLYAFLNQKFV
ncbi:nuclear transport factor 2 family protein [Rhizobium lusitanum]|uniref:nuclear transport factor 2 family protein n=1 Tax=Rhizobium lusitanum TaxID=293958 RepID=UPI00195E5676|nr:nuclear transport factor 2 family protein [Rhizobium lusitanum]MBM7049245.1 nuclear transport factor 2 family protein [Rhizobium lusitanum]